MIEGEGTVERHRRNPHVSVRNTEVETIATLLRFTGVGGVYAEPLSKLGKLPMWEWVVWRKRDLIGLLALIIPYLTGKQERAVELYEEVTRIYG